MLQGIGPSFDLCLGCACGLHTHPEVSPVLRGNGNFQGLTWTLLAFSSEDLRGLVGDGGLGVFALFLSLQLSDRGETAVSEGLKQDAHSLLRNGTWATR